MASKFPTHLLSLNFLSLNPITLHGLDRYLLRELVVEQTVRRWPRWAAVDAALAREGWKLVLLLRLSPIVPWNILNYALAATGVGLMPYTLASAIAVIPWLGAFGSHLNQRFSIFGTQYPKSLN